MATKPKVTCPVCKEKVDSINIHIQNEHPVLSPEEILCRLEMPDNWHQTNPQKHNSLSWRASMEIILPNGAHYQLVCIWMN